MAGVSLSQAASRPAARLRGWAEWRTPVLIVLSLPLILFLVVPVLALLLRVDIADLFAHLVQPQVAQAIALSMVTTALALLTTILFGTPFAYLLARRAFYGRHLLETLIDLPMVLPPAVAGIALLLTFGRRGLLGEHLAGWGIDIAFTQTAVIMAQIFVAAPFYVKSAATGFAGIDREMEQAAALDGASAWRVFRHITLPLAGGALLGGAVMTWARALGEFGATIIFAGNFPGRTQTMPLAIYIGFELDLSIALTLAVILLFVSFAVL
ncbi:MAG: molybdate ABC transporter permease subunit, partial [Caldilineaceae bacterium]|nr:molybdate ABC transporter permease subunit [Caldilineaceae bacterium]